MKFTKESGEGTSHWDIWLMAAIAIVLVAGTIFVSLKMLDQSERHVEAVKEMKVREDVDNAWAPQTAQCDTMVKRDLEENPNRIEAKYSNIQISETSMVYIARMSKLKKLSLSGCNVKDRWFKYLEPLKLQQIALSDSDVSDDSMQQLVKIKTLRSIQLNGCANVSDRGLEIITQLPLTELYLSKTRITNSGVKFLTTCKSLQRLDVSSTKISSSALPQLASMPELFTLDLTDIPIQAKDLAAFKNAPKLYSLNLTRCRIKDDGVKVLSELPLSKINLSENPITGRGLAYLGSASPKLKVLKLENCRRITAPDLEKLRKAKPNCRIKAVDPKAGDLKEAIDLL